jgi:hypothetical protein
MFTLYNIVSDIVSSVVVCVDFLGTHTASLVLFFKIGCDTFQYKSIDTSFMTKSSI